MQELAHDDAVKMGKCGSIIVIRYKATPTRETVKLFEDVIGKLLNENREHRWALLIIIEASIPVPKNTFQTAMAKLMNSADSPVSAIGHVVLGRGFQAAAVRFSIIGTIMLSRAKYPVKVFQDSGKALDWLSTTTPQIVKVGDLPRMRAEIEQFQR
jgi:hypothetical protein